MAFEFVTSLAVLSRGKRVIGGVTINEGDFPWLVHFSAYVPTDHFWGWGYNYKVRTIPQIDTTL